MRLWSSVVNVGNLFANQKFEFLCSKLAAAIESSNEKFDSIATHIKECRHNISISERNYVRIRQSQGSETKIAMTNRFQMGIQLQTTRTSFSLDGILLFTFGHAIDVGPPLLQKWTIITQFDKLNSSKLTAEYDSVANYS